MLKGCAYSCQLPFADLHGQGYDGASAMSGSISGVAQRIKEFCPNAHFIHCLAHCLNLAVSDAGKTVPLLQNALDIVHQLVAFVCNSCKRQDIFTSVQQQSDSDQDWDNQEQQIASAPVSRNTCNTTLRPLCPTRWTVRTSAINSVVCNYDHLMQTLERIQADRTTPTDAASTARGLLKQMEMSETYFRCVVAYRLFAITDAFATAVQRPTINMAEVLRRKREVLGELHVFRGQFDIIFDNTLDESRQLELDEMKLPRKRRVPGRLDDGSGEHFHFEDVRLLQRSHFYEAIDTLISTIDWGLDEQSLQPALTLEQLLINATMCSTVDNDLLNAVTTYHPHLDSQKLKSELILLQGHSITPTIPGIISWFQDGALRASTHSSVYKALATLLVLPTTTASCERSFSRLRRLKTYLRSTMGQERLNSMIVATAHTDMLDSIDVHSVAKEFVSLNDTRRKHYGSFQ
jgi:hypothetical protein